MNHYDNSWIVLRAVLHWAAALTYTGLVVGRTGPGQMWSRTMAAPWTESRAVTDSKGTQGCKECLALNQTHWRYYRPTLSPMIARDWGDHTFKGQPICLGCTKDYWEALLGCPQSGDRAVLRRTLAGRADRRPRLRRSTSRMATSGTSGLGRRKKAPGLMDQIGKFFGGDKKKRGKVSNDDRCITAWIWQRCRKWTFVLLFWFLQW